MKIISIKFLNLNSLKGQHEIRFDRPPFTESGIFAITGPTGAGKTTLLDAITVALYGRVHRHSKDVFEIMTRHTAESYAEVEFEVRDKLYRAKWSIRRSRGKADGQLQTQKMELADAVSGELIMDHPLQEVRDEIVKLCGLDYNQFLRSVILSQGDFTRFLKADENERSELLEKITDTGIYSQISIAAYEKAREERVKLDQLKGKLDHVVLLTQEEREAYTNELAELSAQETNLKLVETGLRTQLDWLNNLEKLELRKAELMRSLSEDELYYATHESRFDQLQKHLAALVHRPALAELNTIEQQQQQIETDLQEAKLQYPDLLKEQVETVTALTQAKEQLEKTEKNINELEPVFELVIKKDILIEQVKAQFDRTNKEVESAELSLQTIEGAKLTLQEQLKAIQKRLAELSVWLEKNAADAALEKEAIKFHELVRQLEITQIKSDASEQIQINYKNQAEQATAIVLEAEKNIRLSEGQLLESAKAIQQLGESIKAVLTEKSLDVLETELRDFPVLIYTAEQQLRLALLQDKLQTEQVSTLEKVQVYRSQLLDGQVLLDTLNKEHTEGTALLNDLQQIYELEVKVQKYDAARLQLAPEQPCPLCGALHHPFVEGNYIGKATEAAERRNLQQEKLQLLKVKLDKHSITVNTLSHQLETAEKSVATNAELIAQTLQEFEDNNIKLPKPLDIHKPKIIAAVIAKKKLEQQALETQLKSAKDLQLQVAELENRVILQRETTAKEKNKAEQAALTIKFAQQQFDMAAKEFGAAELQSKTIYFQIGRLLEPFGIVFDPALSESILGEMGDRYRSYLQAEKELNQLQPDLRQKETELKSNVSVLNERKETIDLLKSQLKVEQKNLQQAQEERIELFGVKDPLQERAQLKAELKKYVTRLEELQRLVQQKQERVRIIEDRQSRLQNSYLSAKKLFKDHLDKLMAKISQQGMSSVEELNKLYLPDEEAKAAELMQKEAAQKIASGKSLLSATVKEMETEQLKELTELTKEVLNPQLEEQLQGLSLLQQEKGRLGKVLLDDDVLKLKHLDVAEQIALQQSESDRFQQLSALIGSADGKKFSRFAQGLTLARLTELANRHLLRLSDRYSILKSIEKDLDLQIIDGYQADVVRPMSTLSGGESFLVSLALALGLSDLASRKVQINSLFIDEGFGTLDAETLDVAITALENLQANGKNIGIISHVEALKERIGTQIQLSREPGGGSRIGLFSYGVRVVEEI